MKNYIRVDGNSQIGLGHIMRCLSIADALKEMGVTSVFITADREAEEFILSRGYEMIHLGSDYTNMEAEIPKLLRIIKAQGIERILVDSYYATKDYFQALNLVYCYSNQPTKSKVKIVVSSKLKIAYLDDLGKFAYPVDLLINYNIYGPNMDYKKMYHDADNHVIRDSIVKDTESTKFIVGCDYAPVRDEFRDVPYTVKDQVENVMITIGGGDNLNIAGALADHFVSKFPEVTFHVVSGAYNCNLPYLKELEGKHKNVKIHHKVEHMSELMKDCDVAISPAGSTVYELCAVGVPTISFYYVQNQRKIAETLHEEIKVINAGDYTMDEELVLITIEEQFRFLCSHYEMREKLHNDMKQLVDGNGAKRIAECLLKV
ncbi:MAG TPA: UDP-2,4-diacetamido-2,4,6-trideoxy-beta-L-altropyranose hydrolase [Lachnospiraceae bacterium]|nr:UDP-2,4-diacetamido-2,4,6-trideoxy-beta-L-altropyranose hydrolase [Lachnospiraceae bacterium]